MGIEIQKDKSIINKFRFLAQIAFILWRWRNWSLNFLLLLLKMMIKILWNFAWSWKLQIEEGWIRLRATNVVFSCLIQYLKFLWFLLRFAVRNTFNNCDPFLIVWCPVVENLTFLQNLNCVVNYQDDLN